MDVVIKSSFCLQRSSWSSKQDSDEYTEWYGEHKEKFSANHDGSSGKRELDSVNEMFAMSEAKFGMKYLNYIRDGDSKTFVCILESNLYGVLSQNASVWVTYNKEWAHNA